jgi:hypothetical protein
MVANIDPKDPVEIIPVTFNFGKLVSQIDTAVVSISVIEGTDENVQSMILGQYQITGAILKQLIRNGVNGARYLIKAVVTDSGGLKYALACYMTVKTED